MKCQRAHALMMSWLDSELETSVTVEVSAHLELCAGCRRRFDAEERLERGVAELLRQDRVPEGEWQRLTAVLHRPNALRWRWAAAAASLLLAFTLALRLTPDAHGLLAEMVRVHRSVAEGEVELDMYTSKGSAIREFLADRRLDGLSESLPGAVEGHAMELLGVREEHLLGQSGVSVTMRCCGVPASMFLMRRERLDALPSAWRKALTAGSYRDGNMRARALLGDELMVSMIWEGRHSPPNLSALARL